MKILVDADGNVATRVPNDELGTRSTLAYDPIEYYRVGDGAILPEGVLTAIGFEEQDPEVEEDCGCEGGDIEVFEIAGHYYSRGREQDENELGIVFESEVGGTLIVFDEVEFAAQSYVSVTSARFNEGILVTVGDEVQVEDEGEKLFEITEIIFAEDGIETVLTEAEADPKPIFSSYEGDGVFEGDICFVVHIANGSMPRGTVAKIVVSADTDFDDDRLYFTNVTLAMETSLLYKESIAIADLDEMTNAELGIVDMFSALRELVIKRAEK